MRYFRTKAFLETFQTLPSDRKKRVARTLEQLDFFLAEKKLPAGLGLKRLRHGIWEVRAGLADRILFQRDGDRIVLLIVGDHDEIRRFLKKL